jgi:hypothetical protein
MRRSKNTPVGKRGVRITEEIIEEGLGWIFRKMDVEDDFGVDALAEIAVPVDDPDYDAVSGRLLALQIKSGKSHFKRATSDGWKFREDSDHLSYWLGHSLPVIVVLVDKAGTAYWQRVTTRTVDETPKGMVLNVPRGQILGPAARNDLLAIAGRNVGLVESLPALYPTLPPEAAAILARTETDDALPTARLADRLSTGRDKAELTLTALVGAQPTWLITSDVAQELWLAVGAYAIAYGHNVLASAAFEHAANSQGPKASRARALAGICLLFGGDRKRARQLLKKARADGQLLLGDMGFAALDIPANDARAVPIPSSIANATPDELDKEPTILNFLAEMALRSNDLNGAIEYRRRAIGSGAEHHDAVDLELARNLIRRGALHGGGSRRDLREAIAIARRVTAQRRRWAGPSGEALVVLLQALMQDGQYREAVQEALAATEGGNAQDNEAHDEKVAATGARAALLGAMPDQYEKFEKLLPESLEKRALQAQRAEVASGANTDSVALWTELAQNADTDEMIARSVSALVRRGVWPPQADDLIARSILPDSEAELLRAIHLTHIEPDAGRAELRRLASLSATAAVELVRSLETIGLDEAIAEATTQQAHWRTLDTTEQLIVLLRRNGEHDKAVKLMTSSMRDATFSEESRQRFAETVAYRHARAGEHEQAAAAAEIGLEIGDDASLSWLLVDQLHRGGHVAQAREALARYHPAPVTHQEISLWLRLHAGTALTPADADTMLEMVQSLSEPTLRSSIVGTLIREVLQPPDQALAPPAFPARIVEAVQALEAEVAAGSITGLRPSSGTDEELREALERAQPDPARFQQLQQDVQRGLEPVAALAPAADRPYGSALVHRAAGALYAADSQFGLRQAGQMAATQAHKHANCVVDLSTVYLLSLMPPKLQARLRAQTGTITVTPSTKQDAFQTRVDVRTTATSTYSAALQPDGSITRTTLSAEQRAQLIERSEALEDLADTLTAIAPTSPTVPPQPSADAIRLAKDLDAPFWCDDAVLRQRARHAGIPTFSTSDLIAITEALKPTDRNAALLALARDYVVDLPLSGAQIAKLARESSWAIGPAHLALSRPGLWRIWGEDWKQHWLKIATAAASGGYDQLLEITKAALIGAIDFAGQSFGTQRYQQLMVLSLYACHQTGLKAAGYLDTIAQIVGDAVAAQPIYVLRALIEEFRLRNVQEPETAAIDLLPGVPLTL